MGRFCQRIVLSGYRRIVSLLSPSLAGGLLNFVMEPVDLPDLHGKALRIVEFNMSRLPEYVKDLVLKSKLPTTISSTVNPTGSTQGLKRTAYREMIFASAVAVVLAIIAFLVSIYYPFFRFRKIETKLLGKISKGKYKPTTLRRSDIPLFFKRWYIAFGITGLVMMVLLALDIAGLAASTGSVEFALRSAVANPNLGDTSILSTIDMISAEVNSFFDELIEHKTKMKDILGRVVGELDLGEHLKSLKELWTSAYSYKEKVNSQLRKAQTFLKAVIPYLHLFFTIFGYIIILSLLILLVLSLVQYIFCVKQGKKMITSDHPTAEPTTRHPPSKRISTIITLVSMYAPIVLLFSAVPSIVTTLIANEGCRYIDDDDALRITDIAVDLAIKYRWADWLRTKLPKLELHQREHVLRSLIKDCRTLLNLRDAVDKSVRKSIEGYEDTVCDRIAKMDISKNLPTSLDDLPERMEHISHFKYTGIIDKFKALQKNKTQMEEKLDKVHTFAEWTAGYTAHLLKKLVEEWKRNIRDSSIFDKMARDAFSGFDLIKDKYELIKRAKEVLNNVTSVLGKEGVRKVVKSSIKEIESHIQIISETFSKDIIPCHRLRKITNGAIDALCRDQGILTALGAYFFFLGLAMFHLIFTILLTRIYFSAHGFLHLWLLL